VYLGDGGPDGGTCLLVSVHEFSGPRDESLGTAVMILPGHFASIWLDALP
jgi:hypothetical protein